ncbi:uncharacterized protein C8Q71DRAFT_695759, partial [Rhodofomes roseus]
RRDFDGCFMHFNHFVKVHQQSLLHQKYLLGYLGRGAAVLCANSQPGVDAVLTGIRSLTAHTSNLIPILVQSKNDMHYTARPDERLFEAMNPYDLGIWGPNDANTNKRVIRVVFALAVQRENAQVTMKRREITKVGETFVSYDIWIAGLASRTITPISLQEE